MTSHSIKNIGHLIRNERRLGAMASTIFGGQVVGGITGFCFWALAAHEMVKDSVGVAGASTGAMTLIGPLGMLGIGTLLIAELPRLPLAYQRRTVFDGLVTVAVAAGAMGLVFAVVGGATLKSFMPLFNDPWSLGWFVVGSALTGVCSVFDQIMLVIGAPGAQVARNLVTGLVKLVVLVGLVYFGNVTSVSAALGAWSLGLLAGAALAITAILKRLPRGGRQQAPYLQVARQYRRRALEHHGVNVALFSGSLLQPVIMGSVLSAGANADFTAIRLVTMFAFLAPFAISMAFFASSVGSTASIVRRSERVTAASLGVAVSCTAGLWFLGPYLLDLFGSGYRSSLDALRIMSLGVPLLVFKDQYVALARAADKVGSALWVAGLGALLEVGATLLGSAVGGLTGSLTAWISVLLIEAIYSWRGLRVIRGILSNPRAGLAADSLSDRTSSTYLQEGGN
jgi:O-antigen/teichoic acid export membrane protein